MYELIINQKEGSIQFSNYEEIKKSVEEYTKKYQGLVITEDDTKDIKKVNTELNNLAKALNDEKIKVKKEYMKPLELFENQVKELIAILKDTRAELDDQVKSFENKEKEEKKQALIDYYNSLNFDLVEYERLHDDKWLNKTTTLKKAFEELDSKVNSVKNDLEILDNFNVVDKELLKSFYLETLNVKEAKEQYDSLMNSKSKVANQEEVVHEVQETKEYLFKVFSEEDYEKIRKLMLVEGIKYEVIK